MRHLGKHPHSHPHSSKGALFQIGEFVGASSLAGYALGAKPDWMRVMGVPTIPLVGAALLVGSYALSKFGVGGLLGKTRTHATVVGTALVATYAAMKTTSYGFPSSGRTRLVVASGDVGKIKAAVPSATIVGVSERAPAGNELNASDIEALARRIR